MVSVALWHRKHQRSAWSGVRFSEGKIYIYLPGFLKTIPLGRGVWTCALRAHFCRSETKVGNLDIMSVRRPFFFSPLFPPFSLLFRVVSRLFGVIQPGFWCRSSENGQIELVTFSKIQVDVAIKCCQMVRNGRISADEEPFQHFLEGVNGVNWLAYNNGFL